MITYFLGRGFSEICQNLSEFGCLKLLANLKLQTLDLVGAFLHDDAGMDSTNLPLYST